MKKIHIKDGLIEMLIVSKCLQERGKDHDLFVPLH